MNNKELKGIALILFGILLCTGSTEINNTLFYRFTDFPFAPIGVIFGAAGLAMIFLENRNNTNK